MKRVIVGQRGSQFGVWVSPPGVDVETAPASLLSMAMDTDYTQVALIGYATAGSFIPTNFSSPPHVFLIGIYSNFISRPYPSAAGFPFSPGAKGTDGYASVGSNGFSLSYSDAYLVFRRSF